MRRVLFIAFHFPPYAGGSGILRSLKFCLHLPSFGWLPTVLTANPLAYESVGTSQLEDIPVNVRVFRAFALDAQRHLAVRGRYFRWTALPDRWASWCPAAVLCGVYAIYRHRIDVILTTFPIGSAALIGLILNVLTGRPWIADFRDSMTEDEYPRYLLTRRIYRWIESQAARRASRLVFTAPSTIEMYLKRYPWLNREKCLLIPNGYDEEDFQGLIPDRPQPVDNHRPLRLVHLGLLYPEERDPKPFFQAVSRLKQEGRLATSDVQFEFRACGFDEVYTPMLRDAQIDDVVRLLPRRAYREALQDAASADGLLLFQAACCSHQIPAKAYEYLRLGRPILAFTSETGDTAALLHDAGGATIIDLANEEAIYRSLPIFLERLKTGSHPLPDPVQVASYGRRQQAQRLAHCLSEVVGEEEEKGPGGAGAPGSSQSE